MKTFLPYEWTQPSPFTWPSLNILWLNGFKAGFITKSSEKDRKSKWKVFRKTRDTTELYCVCDSKRDAKRQLELVVLTIL